MSRHHSLTSCLIILVTCQCLLALVTLMWSTSCISNLLVYIFGNQLFHCVTNVKLKSLDKGPAGKRAASILLWNSTLKPRQSSAYIFCVLILLKFKMKITLLLSEMSKFQENGQGCPCVYFGEITSGPVLFSEYSICSSKFKWCQRSVAAE